MACQFQLNMTIESQTVTIQQLRIQIPDPQTVPVAPTPQKKVEAKEMKYEDHTEYVPASPRYTWDQEQVRSVKLDRFGELLWPVVMARYGLESTPHRPASLYASYLASEVSRFPEKYVHHTLQDLMEYYIENQYKALKGTKMSREEWDQFERRKILRRMVLKGGWCWFPDVFHVYLSWRQTLPPRPLLNRYQKIQRFVEEFFH